LSSAPPGGHKRVAHATSRPEGRRCSWRGATTLPRGWRSAARSPM